MEQGTAPITTQIVEIHQDTQIPVEIESVDTHGITDAESHTETHTEEHSGIHVALAPEQIGTFLGLPITNTLFTSLIVSAVLMGVAVLLGSRLKVIPGRMQLFFEELVSGLHGFIENALEDARLARKYFPLLAAVFIFIAFANLTEFIPGVGSVGFTSADGAFSPLLRSVNTDLNNTLALTFIVVFAIEMAGVLAHGFWGYMHKFFNFSSPINFIVGIIEFVTEAARIISFSFRLFGNIFAGEVLIAVVTYFVPYVLPVPLMAFEMFVGVVQGLIFMLLTLFFIKLAVSKAH
jgi:F-type H+-transporting ATPase subunit a